MSETLEQAQTRYLAAMHAVQSGIAGQMATAPVDNDDAETTPKHLRVGVNSALISSSAVVKLLIELGLITELEYFCKLADLAEDEKRTYEQRLTEYYGKPVTLS